MGLVVKKNVAAIARQAGVGSISEDYLPALEEKVRKLVEDSVRRASSNNRKTLMARDV